VDQAAAELTPIEELTRKISSGYKRVDLRPGPLLPESVRSLAFVDASAHHGAYDKTLLLLLGQERAGVSIVLDQDTLTLAARYDSGVSFLDLLGLSGGMPTLVSVPKARIHEALRKLGADESSVLSLAG
jgi:hypothetical protein